MPTDTQKQPSTRQDPEIPGRSREHEANPRGDEEPARVTEAQRELEREVEPNRKKDVTES